MVNKLTAFYKLIRYVLLRTIYFTVAFLLLEFFTISLVYHNEIKDINNRVQQTVSAGGHDIYLICNYINCKNIIEENIHYVNTEIGIVVNEKNDTNSKILFAFFNSDLDSVIRHNNTLFIVNNDSKWNFINRSLALSTFILFIVIFIFSFKIRLDVLKKESYARNSFKNDLESKLQRDLTESLHHEMGTPLAVIRTLLDEIIKTIYPCGVTESGICTLKVSNKKIPDCKDCEVCGHNYNKRALDSTISEYYEQIRLALDSLFTLQTLIGKSKRISYSNGTVSLFEILNNVILSSNQLRIKNITPDYRNKGILDTHSCRGIQNGEMLIIVNNMVLNSIEANANKIVISAETKDDMLELTIRDNGRGIRDNNNNIIKDYNIFNYGYSTKDIDGINIITDSWLSGILYKLKILSRDNEFRGAGLSLCKDLLKKNGGDIILVDTNKEGTTFKLIIPTKITHTTDKVVEYLS